MPSWQAWHRVAIHAWTIRSSTKAPWVARIPPSLQQSLACTSFLWTLGRTKFWHRGGPVLGNATIRETIRSSTRTPRVARIPPSLQQSLACTSFFWTLGRTKFWHRKNPVLGNATIRETIRSSTRTPRVARIPPSLQQSLACTSFFWTLGRTKFWHRKNPVLDFKNLQPGSS